jgi:copper resistance protein B
MSTLSTISCTCGAVFALASAAVAQIPAAPDTLALPGERESGQPIMDREIVAHAILNEDEGRWNGTNTQYRWDGEGWVGTDLQQAVDQVGGTLLSNGTLEDGQHQFLYDRAITTYFDLQGGLRSDIDSLPTRNWAALGIQG